MSHLPRATAIWRWLRAAAAFVAACVATLYFSLFVLAFGPYPQDLAAPTAGFLQGSLPVLAGSLLAPRWRLATAVVLFGLATALGAWVLPLHPVGGWSGGLLAVAFVAWWSHPHRTPRATRRVGIVACGVLSAFLGLVYARYVDWPARPEPLPSELSSTLGAKASRVTAFYHYDLGGFLDHEWLWRFDAEPGAVALVVSGLGLQRTSAVPSRFWRMPPHYWPRSLPPGAEAFRSASFSGEDRGPDGPHFLLLHDEARHRAFVWLKNNF